MKVSVIGTGYVGLVTGTCLAEVGNDVLCLDVDVNKINILKQGGIPIYEPGLEDMVRRNVAAGRLRFTTDVAESARHGAIQFIAVGTPPDEDGSADLQYVVAAARTIGRMMAQPFDEGGDLGVWPLPHLARDEKNLGLGRLDADTATAGATRPAFRLCVGIGRLLHDLVHRAVQVRDEAGCVVPVRTEVAGRALPDSLDGVQKGHFFVVVEHPDYIRQTSSVDRCRSSTCTVSCGDCSGTAKVLLMNTLPGRISARALCHSRSIGTGER